MSPLIQAISAILAPSGPKGWLNLRVPGCSHFWGKVACPLHYLSRYQVSQPLATHLNKSENIMTFLSISAILSPSGPKGWLNLRVPGCSHFWGKVECPLHYLSRYQVPQPLATHLNKSENIMTFLSISAILTLSGPKGWLNLRVPGVSHFSGKVACPLHYLSRYQDPQPLATHLNKSKVNFAYGYYCEATCVRE